MPGTRGSYRRVLLKLSGEVFGGEKGIGVDPDVLADVAALFAKLAADVAANSAAEAAYDKHVAGVKKMMNA